MIGPSLVLRSPQCSTGSLIASAKFKPPTYFNSGRSTSFVERHYRPRGLFLSSSVLTWSSFVAGPPSSSLLFFFSFTGLQLCSQKKFENYSCSPNSYSKVWRIVCIGISLLWLKTVGSSTKLLKLSNIFRIFYHTDCKVMHYYSQELPPQKNYTILPQNLTFSNKIITHVYMNYGREINLEFLVSKL
ncbi:hypothetical protein KC19_4G247600 [Ceratodon purpureus]|uniref:Uncharacterized protein n=1 Tax=Ceratodon purpureus TaxID=3225 RepID=A0A8T0IET3_CERPU|nr:hypothetical protein KC19_4G247600 [Ceratodon purpureus]